MSQSQPEPVRIRTQERKARGANRTYVTDIHIGRSSQCDVQIEANMVSRVHAKIVHEDGQWWVVDDNSTNGTYLNGERVDRAALPAEGEVRLGENGPVFQLTRPEASGSQASASTSGPAASRSPQPGASAPQSPSPASGSTAETSAEPPSTGASAETSAEAPSSASTSSSSAAANSASGQGRGASRPSDASVSKYIEHYFESDQDRPAGEHTQLMREAYQQVQQKQKRRYVWVLAAAAMLCVMLGGYAFYQHMKNEQLQGTAEQVFMALKEQEVMVAQLKRRIEESGNASLKQQLAALEEQQARQQKRYEGYVKELGLYRELTEKEKEIYRVARIFGESEFSIPAGFVRKVKRTIDEYWTGVARSGYVNAIERAEENGYTPFIVKTMQDHGLPPEFFYLALQESRMQVDAVGPETRWGIAKGMWQFIPSTARRYGLRTGPRADTRVVDQQDDRHDFKKATQAAARYLQTIYSTEAQASGLLVIASYNWGEHRVINKLDRLPGPQGIPEQALKGIPENPEKRNYWRFLTEYEDRMPAETKDYVLKVFAAAVIGQNPRLFGFDFDNPLKEHMETTTSKNLSWQPRARPEDAS